MVSELWAENSSEGERLAMVVPPKSEYNLVVDSEGYRSVVVAGMQTTGTLFTVLALLGARDYPWSSIVHKCYCSNCSQWEINPVIPDG